MVLQEQVKSIGSSQGPCRGLRDLTAKDILQCMSSLILPLLLGLFTIIITFHQQKMGREQRLEDMNEAKEHRRHELDLTTRQNDAQRLMAFERYRDEVLVAYIKEISELLEKNNGSLIRSSIVANIARVKTLNAIRQLDQSRNIHIIRFLYEAEQLTDSPTNRSLDLSTAELRDVDFCVSPINRNKLDKISLVNVIFSNVSFACTRVMRSNFSFSEFLKVNYSSTRLDNIDFSSALLENVLVSSGELLNTNFFLSRLGHINFPFAKLNGINFSQTSLEHVDFSSALIENVSFASAKLHQANFASARLFDVHFTSATLRDIDFSNALLKNVDFSYAQLDNVSFSSARLDRVIFSSAKLYKVNYSSIPSTRTHLTDISFHSTLLDVVTFSSARIYNVSFSSSQHFFVNFSSTVLGLANFNKAKLFNSTFERAHCVAARFDQAKLTHVQFWRAHAKSALFNDTYLINVNFSYANLQNANFNGTSSLTHDQLQSALAIRDACLPNGTVVSGSNLIENGYAQCNISLVNNWKIRTGNVTIATPNDHTNNCHFLLQSYDIGATMWQRISLVKPPKSHFDFHPKGVLTAHMSRGVSIHLSATRSTEKIFAEKNLSWIRNTTLMDLRGGSRKLEVFVQFHDRINQTNQKSAWCDNIELFIDYDTNADESDRTEPIVSLDARWMQNAVTIIGGYGRKNRSYLLSSPMGLYVAEDLNVLVVDRLEHRVLEWKPDRNGADVVAGGNGPGKRLDQLNNPTGVVSDKKTDSLIICDRGNGRVMQWSRLNREHGETIIKNIQCGAITMDDQRYLYFTDWKTHAVRRYRIGETEGTVVAGNHGEGSDLQQLNTPTYVFVDRDQSVFVSDTNNHRVVKWLKGATSGTIVAGGQGQGNALTQLNFPRGVFIDYLDTVYVAEEANDRVMRWFKNANQGKVIVGGNGEGREQNQFNCTADLALDRYGNLYVIDRWNTRVQRFSLA